MSYLVNFIDNRYMSLLTPNKLFPQRIKNALGCISKKPVIYQGEMIMIRNKPLCNHDLYHLEVAQLERIQIGKHLVSGVHGINAPILHDSPIIVEYDGILDEVRVAFHEFMLRTSIYNTFKLISWMFWLLFHGINPTKIFWQHYVSLKKFAIENNANISTSSFLNAGCDRLLYKYSRSN